MNAIRRRLLVLGALAAVAAGCGDHVSLTPAAQTTPAPPPEIQAKDFATAKFDHSTTIDHKWFPLVPGTQLDFSGSSVDDGERLSHRVIFTVTDLTKRIGNVETVVAWERDFTNGVLEEAELVFFAQDNDGNVWHLGQYPEEYDEDGKIVGHPAWIAGLAGARAGVFIRANPRLGSSDYAQGFAPKPVNWVDRARVYEEGVRTCVPAACFTDVVVTEEFELNKPDAYQLKYYAPGVGNVRVGWRGAKEDQREVLVLERVKRLRAAGLADARREALKLEDHAYRLVGELFLHTERAK